MWYRAGGCHVESGDLSAVGNLKCVAEQSRVSEFLHAGGNMNLGNDKAFLIKIVSQCLPYIGYPRSLNAVTCINNAAAAKTGSMKGQGK